MDDHEKSRPVNIVTLMFWKTAFEGEGHWSFKLDSYHRRRQVDWMKTQPPDIKTSLCDVAHIASG